MISVAFWIAVAAFVLGCMLTVAGAVVSLWTKHKVTVTAQGLFGLTKTLALLIIAWKLIG